MATRPSHPRRTADRLAAAAAASTSLVDMLGRLDMPLGSGPLGYLRERVAHHGIDTSHFTDEPLPHRPRRTYSKEVLAEAAARSHSLREVIEYLGAPPYDSAYSHLKRRLAHFGIDTSHFTGRKGPTALIDGEPLARAAAQSHSLADLIRRLELVPGGASRALVKRSLATAQVPTEHFLGQGHGRGRPCSRRRSADDVLRRLPSGAPRAKRELLHRALREKKVPYVCGGCGTGDAWMGHRLVLEIDHINGDRLDNRLENLRYLCPSCHSQTRSYAGRRPGAITAAPRRIGTQ